MLLDDWSPARRPVPDRDEALGIALVRFLEGRAPATPTDFAAWTKLPLGDARRARAVAGGTVVDLGAERLVLAHRPATRGIPTAHLLPGFDEYLLGYADRSVVLDHPLAHVASANGIFWPVVLVRGRVVGRWSRSPGAEVLTVKAFESLSGADRRAVEAAAGRYAAFIGRPLSVDFAEVPA